MRKRYLHADGHHVWADLSVSLVRDRRGQAAALRLAHRRPHRGGRGGRSRSSRSTGSCSEQKPRLERSNADLEAFAMLASHDLQAPLATIRGYMELLESTYDERLRRARERLGRRGSTGRRPDVASWSTRCSTSPGSAADARSARTVSVAELVEEVRARPRPADHATRTPRSIVDRRHARPCSPTGSRLRQVLQNLIQNALKYRHPDRPPHCEVVVEERDADWLVTVTDNAARDPAGAPGAGLLDVRPAGRRRARARHRPGGLPPDRGAARRDDLGGRTTRAGEGSRFCFTLPR